MVHYDWNLRALAMGFAGLAGFVDAIGFLKSGGLFVSFMTGNSTRLAVGLAEATSTGAAAAALIALFVLGVAIAAMFTAARGTHRKAAAASLVAFLLTAAAIFQSIDWNLPALALLCLAMGASNTIFQRDGEVSVGVTYMTGTLVRLGYRIADAFRGQRQSEWLPYFLIWLALVIGGVAGALTFAQSQTISFWIAAAAAVILAASTALVTLQRKG